MKRGKVYNSIQWLALVAGPLLVLSANLEPLMKFGVFVLLYGFASILMDIKGLLLDPERAREELGNGEKL
jgi:hypothetical protein